MRIAMIGYGRMGQIITRIARERGHDVVTIDPTGNADHDSIIEGTVDSADVCIDFTHPDAVVENIKTVSSLGKSIVVGTTGWQGQLDSVRAMVESAGTGLLHAPNFSIGMRLFSRIVDAAAKLMDRFDQYDVSGVEWHHTGKADAPSGTAKSLAEQLVSTLGRKERAVYDRPDGAVAPDELHFSSVRVGSVPGTHMITFDSDADTIELTHRARNREGFALGAVLAAEWLAGKKGVFTLDDMMDSMTEAGQ
ncbi:MAG: 4-hydroxy-tetrahydrodipicolinate reductase [archaeon]